MSLTTLCIEGRGLCAPVVGNLLAERESFTSSVFAVFHGHNIILYCEHVPLKGELKVINNLSTFTTCIVLNSDYLLVGNS